MRRLMQVWPSARAGRGSVMQVACHHPPSSGRFLSIEEREVIHAGVHQNLSIRAIARSIDRHPSTVLRELRDNMHHQQYRSRSSLNPSAAGRPRSTGWNYAPHLAQKRADNNAMRSQDAKLKTNHRLQGEVQRRLKKKFSPEQIAKRLRIDYPDDLEMRVSHETIYQSLYVQGRGALKRDLTACLRTGRAVRKPHRKTGERRGRIPNMVNSSERPAEVEDRAVDNGLIELDRATRCSQLTRAGVDGCRPSVWGVVG